MDTTAERQPTWIDRLGYWGLSLVIAVLRRLPVDTASAFMGSVWRLVAPLTRRQARAIEHFRAAYPEKSDADLKAMAAAMWENLGRVFAEGLILDRIVADPTRVTTRLDLLDTAVLQQLREKGGVVVSLHLGNWEIVSQAAFAAGVPIAGVYQKLSNPLADRVLYQIRAPHYADGLLAKGPDTAKKMLSQIRRKRVVAVLADHRDYRGLLAPFLGAPAWMSRVPAVLARTFNTPMIAVRVVRVGPGARFSIEFEVIDVPRTDKRDDDIDVATLALNAVFEDWIRERPAEWMWIHKRWKQPGDPDANHSNNDAARPTSLGLSGD